MLNSEPKDDFSWPKILMLLVIAFSATCLVLLVLMLSTRKTAFETLKWPETTGKVTESKMLQSCHGKAFSPNIIYSFEVNSVRYQGYTIKTGGSNCLAIADVNAFLTAYPVGKSVSVYFDPNDPTQSALNRGADRNNSIQIGRIVSMLVLLFVAFLFLRFKVKY